MSIDSTTSSVLRKLDVDAQRYFQVLDKEKVTITPSLQSKLKLIADVPDILTANMQCCGYSQPHIIVNLFRVCVKGMARAWGRMGPSLLWNTEVKDSLQRLIIFSYHSLTLVLEL